MSSFSEVIIIGNLVATPELSYVGSNGVALLTGTVAINKSWKDKRTGEWQEKASYIDWKAWRGTAERLSKYCEKGEKVMLVGQLEQERWQNDKGEKRSRVVVEVRHGMLLTNSGFGRQGPDGEVDKDPKTRAKYPSGRSTVAAGGGLASGSKAPWE